MSCHATATIEASPADILLVGHPNVGKSVLFQRLTGRYVTVSNYPGTTVDVFRGAARDLAGTTVVDTPGVVAFPARTEDEEVVSELLLRSSEATVVQVGDAKSLRRTLQLTVQLAELGLPFVLVLNMQDEAAAAGVSVDRDAIAAAIGASVIPTVATQGIGIAAVTAALEAALPATVELSYPSAVEAALAELDAVLPTAPAPRGLGLLWLSGDGAVRAHLEEEIGSVAVERLGRETEERLGEPAAVAIRRVRDAFVDGVVEGALRQEPQSGSTLAARLGRLTTHPFWGWCVLGAALLLMYWVVGVVGAGKLVGLLENSLFGRHLNPWLTHEVERLVPVRLLSDLLVGQYGLWTMGMTYALALILPIVTTFFLAFSALEDSGYLSRLAVVSNRLFRVLGLNGKAALPMVLGLGCVTMATLTTRILETRRERLLATLLLALGIPCSAQLGVVLGMLGSISFVATLIWGVVVAATVLAVGALAARLVPGERSPLVVELPPLRVPRPGNVIVKTLVRLEWYLREVVPLFLAGTALLFLLDRIGALPAIIHAGRPVVGGWLGLPATASAAFLIGFLRRDFGATGLFVMHAQGLLSAEQSVVAMVTITLFIPCVASILIIVRERGAAVAAGMVVTIFPLAFLVGGLLNQTLRAAGWGA